MRNIYTGTGKSFDSITLEAVMNGSVKYEDIKISKNTLMEQAEIARKHGNIQQAENFKRAAELIDFSDDEVLEMYNMLRPNRSTESELVELERRLVSRGAAGCGALVRDCIEVYKKRGLLI